MPRGRKKVVEEAPSNGQLAVKEPEVVEAEVIPEQESPLSEQEREDLDRLEAQIRSAVWSAAKALWEINTRRLYRERYKTFDDYCQAQFQFSPVMPITKLNLVKFSRHWNNLNGAFRFSRNRSIKLVPSPS